MTHEELVAAIAANAQPGETFAELRGIGYLAGAKITIEGQLREVGAAALYLNEINGAGIDLIAYYDTAEGEGVRRQVGALERDPNYDTAGVWIG